MVCMTLKLEAWPGSSIDTAAEEACRLAGMLGVDVEFDFNGVKCIALPGGEPHVLAENQQIEQRRPAARRLPVSTNRSLGAGTVPATSTPPASRG